MSSFLIKDHNKLDPIVITYDNNPSANTFKYLETLEKNKWNYKLIGVGEKWNGYMSKMIGYTKELAERFENKEEEEARNRIYVVTDARDVLCLKSPENFAKIFESKNPNGDNKLVVSMELFCDGNTNVPDDYVGKQCVSLKKYWDYHGVSPLPSRKFVNSGLICGKAEVLLDFYKFVLENRDLHKDDDQLALGLFMNAFPEKVAADVDAVLLHTCGAGVNAGIQDISAQSADAPSLAEISGSGVGGGAFFLHIPGLVNIKGQQVYYDTVSKMM